MFKITPQCSECEKEIQEIYVKMRYPDARGMTEIKAFLQYEGKIICEGCYNK